jgi:hypothetical protein
MKRKAQTVIEYSVLIAIVAAAFIAMSTYVKRAAQANLKLMEEKANAAPDTKFIFW